MTRVYTVLLMLTISLTINAQSQVEALLNDAKKYNQAYLDGDMEACLSMTIPSVIEVAGGEEIMLANAKEMYKITKESGTETISVEPLKPSKFMFAGRNLQSLLPQKIIQKIGETKFSKVVYFLANSADEGKSWTFLDLEPYDTKSIRTFVPNASDSLVIPPAELPELID